MSSTSMRKRVPLYYPHSICPLMYMMRADTRIDWYVKVTPPYIRAKAVRTQSGVGALHDFHFEIWLEEYYGHKSA